MTENMKKFLSRISEDQELAEKLSKAEKEAMIAEAKEMGVELTDADFAPEESVLSEDELEAVAGGAECMCVVGGGGKKDEAVGDKACGCAFYGQGNDKNGSGRCLCPLSGAGYASNTSYS